MDDLNKYNQEGSDLRKAQLIMLNILKEVSTICDRHNIPYWLSFGTLLGAMRHNGFIPWDDDLDIEVELKDYNKLLSLLELELPSNMLIQHEKNERYYCFKYAKVRDIKSIIHEDASLNFKERGIFIDIFPRECSKTILKKIAVKLLGNSLVHLKNKNFENKKKYYSKKTIFKLRILVSKYFVFFARLISRVLTSSKMFTSLDITSKFTGIERQNIFPLKEIYFEGYKFKCPSNSDAYLKAYYGDYMKIPSPEKRIFHSSNIEFL